MQLYGFYIGITYAVTVTVITLQTSSTHTYRIRISGGGGVAHCFLKVPFQCTTKG